MIPILYDSKTEDFQNNGIGLLTECTRCMVTEERNGAYELEFSYPVTGLLFQYIAPDCYLKAKPNETDQPQLFSVYKVTKPINGIITGYAEHISYQLNDNLISGGFTASGGAAMVMGKLLDGAMKPHRFTAWSDITAVHTLTVPEPGSIRSWLGGTGSSVLETWGGEFSYDNYDIRLHANRGQDIGVTIEYGKNLTSMEQESSIEEMYTALYPYAKYTPEGEGAEEITVELPGKLLYCENYDQYSHGKIVPRDFSKDFAKGEPVTVQLLEDRAKRYMRESGFGIPRVNLKASFVQLWQTAEYAGRGALERVGLCDLVTVRFTKLGIDVKSRVIKTVYDSLTGRYDQIELGDAKNSFVDTVNSMGDISSQIQDETEKQSAWFSKRLAEEIKKATEAITGQTGGHVVLNPENNPRELLILDIPDRAAAVNVWRWNLSGLGYSSHGINGPYELAITADGRIIADFILAGSLEGALLKAGSVSAEALSVEWVKELTDRFTGVVTEVTQLFEAADGKLESRIGQQITDATGALESRMSAFTQTVDDIEMLFRVVGAGEEPRTGKTRFSRDGLEIFDGGIRIYNRYGAQVLYVDTSGNLVMNGVIQASTGYIGGFNVSDVSLITGGTYGEGNSVALFSQPSQNDHIGIAVGANYQGGDFANAPVRLYTDGNITCKSSTVQGTMACDQVMIANSYLWEVNRWLTSGSSFDVRGTMQCTAINISDSQNRIYNDGGWITCNTNFWVHGSGKGQGYFDGLVTALGGWSTSDVNMKNNIEDADFDGLSIVLELPHKSFNWNSDTPQGRDNSGYTKHVSCGYIAQELEKINPELVLKPQKPEGGILYQVNHAFMSAITTRSIQQLNEKVQSLETELSDLKALLKEKGVIE